MKQQTQHTPAPLSEVEARIVLAQYGAGGGLAAHATDNGWVFAPYLHIAGRDAWLVTHDGHAASLHAPARPLNRTISEAP